MQKRGRRLGLKGRKRKKTKGYLAEKRASTEYPGYSFDLASSRTFSYGNNELFMLIDETGSLFAICCGSFAIVIKTKLDFV